jgi:hypothetical protein
VSNSYSRAYVLAVAVAAVALSGYQVWWIWRDMHAIRDSREVEGSLRRLAALTIRNFPARDLDSSALFWKSIGREDKPMLDLWGTEYRLSVTEENGVKVFHWASAGPDRVFGTRDDVTVEVPYPNGPGFLPDLAPGELPVTPPQSFDAK